MRLIKNKHRLFLGLTFVFLFFITALGAGIKNFSSATKTAEAQDSVEVGFTSFSPKGEAGGSIIPASCESDIWGYGWPHFRGDTYGVCAAVVPPVSYVPPICAATHYNCISGTSNPAVEREYVSGWTWECNGSGPAATRSNSFISCQENKPIIPVCAATHNNCVAGTPINIRENATSWYWTCRGPSSRSSCSELKAPVCAPTQACTSAANACDMRSPGTTNCTGVCSATTPSNALCIPAALNICPSSAIVSTTGPERTKQLQGYYTPLGTSFSGCVGSPNGSNVNDASTWTSSIPGNATVNNNTGTSGIVTGVARGNTTINATYPGVPTATASITITCSPNNSCSTQPALNTTCRGTPFSFTDSCGDTQNCTGERNCDFNWKEVAP